MHIRSPQITYIGGPMALIEWRGLRLLTDPTFEPVGTAYSTATYTLPKSQGPALGASALGRLDGVLLSHDHHFDNLDHAGRALLRQVPRVLTTSSGAARLGHPAVGLAPWEEIDLPTPDGGILRITGTPARQGPPHADRGPVTGLVLASLDAPIQAAYISGDTVWYEGVQEVSARFAVRTAVLFLGAARIPAVGDWHLTLTAAVAVAAAHAFADAEILPLHFEGWEHFSESRAAIDHAFAQAGPAHRLRWPVPGRAMDLMDSHEDSAAQPEPAARAPASLGCKVKPSVSTTVGAL